MCCQGCTTHTQFPRVASPCLHLPPLQLISSTIPHCCPSPLWVTLTLSLSRNVQVHSLSHGRGWSHPSPGRDRVGSRMLWRGLACPDSHCARSWQSHRQPTWDCPNLITCWLPSGCQSTMHTARTRLWVGDGDSLGSLHTPSHSYETLCASDTAL